MNLCRQGGSGKSWGKRNGDQNIKKFIFNKKVEHTDSRKQAMGGMR